MRLIFAGTPDFAATVLQAVLETEHEVCAVYTQPDRPAGRGRKLTPSPVKQLAVAHRISVEQPLDFKDASARQRLAQYEADLMIVVAYGLILPQSVLDTPRYGCLNVHASLLPRWRGAAPIQRAILAGDTETGVSIMQMEAGLDTGPVLSQAVCPIYETDTAQTLHDRLAPLGAKLLVAALNNLPELQAQAQPQDEVLSTYAQKLKKAEAQIDWTQSAIDISRQIRALNPWPVAQTHWQGQVFRIWLAMACADSGTQAEPGEVVAVTKSGVDVASGAGIVRLQQVQLPGKRAMSVTDFLNANPIQVGTRFG